MVYILLAFRPNFAALVAPTIKEATMAENHTLKWNLTRAQLAKVYQAARAISALGDRLGYKTLLGDAMYGHAECGCSKDGSPWAILEEAVASGHGKAMNDIRVDADRPFTDDGLMVIIVVSVDTRGFETCHFRVLIKSDGSITQIREASDSSTARN